MSGDHGTVGPAGAVAVVLAGGKGTRAADPSIAKLAQEVGGRPLMAWHLDVLQSSGIMEVLVVAGHLGEQVQGLCEQLDAGRLRLRVLHEARQEGTVAALRLAAQHTDAEQFLVILGDILMSLPVRGFLDAWLGSNAGVGVVVHPSAHPHDSDAVVPLDDGGVLVVPKTQARDLVPNVSSAGLFAVSREALERHAHARDIGSGLLPAAAEDGDLFAFVSSHYLKDTGTPDRLGAARQDVDSGAFARRGSLGARPALFLDRDGVINPAVPEFYRPEDYCLNPGVADAIRQVNQAGIPVIVVTNQPHIAKGFMTFDDHRAVRARMDRLLGEHGAFVDDYLFCPHHPEAGHPGEVPQLKVPCDCRKPGVALARLAADRHGMDLAASVMVGDSERDRRFAADAGMRFVHVSAGCNACQGQECFPDPATSIKSAAGAIPC